MSGPLNVTETALPGVLVLEPAIHRDTRGAFMEIFHERAYRDQAGIRLPFVQDNFSISGRNVLRGLHFQRRRPQGKLIIALAGGIFDVVVDIDPDSTHFGTHVAIELSVDNRRQLWVPPGYAHGFCVTTPSAHVLYKCTDYYDPGDEGGLAWDCPRLAIPWPVRAPVLSPKDRSHPGLTPGRATGPRRPKAP